jgi:hypothetical protein
MALVIRPTPKLSGDEAEQFRVRAEKMVRGELKEEVDNAARRLKDAAAFFLNRKSTTKE